MRTSLLLALSLLLFCVVDITLSLSVPTHITNNHHASVEAGKMKEKDWYTVYVAANGTYYVEDGKDESGVAWAKYTNDMHTTGWANLEVHTNAKQPDKVQMYGAGFLEGFITTELIYDNYYNIFTEEWDSVPFNASLVQWLLENEAYMMSQASKSSDPYWAHVALVWTQLQGVYDGYTKGNTDAKKALSLNDFLMMNMDGDLEDLLPALNLTNIDWTNMTNVALYHFDHLRCSALVKVAADFSEIFVGHTTWENYFEMTRMFKIYDFPLSTANTNSKVVMFSSYPGTISSIDDFYLMDTGLVVTETTNGIMNNSLYIDTILPQSVLSFIRVIVANRIAKSGADWINVFSRENSGTYNNQWIVVDNNKLNKGVGLQPGALYILEQIPGYIATMDATPTLSYGYWPSYNVPYFEYIYNISDFPHYVKKFGAMFAYEDNPRGEIFSRDSGKITTITDMQKMMRSNHFQTDPLSQGNAGNAISARFDLNPKHIENPFLARDSAGGIDSKVTSTSLAQKMQVYAQSGPTHDDQTPFSYDEYKKYKDISHKGQPTVWNFDWILVQA